LRRWALLSAACAAPQQSALEDLASDRSTQEFSAQLVAQRAAHEQMTSDETSKGELLGVLPKRLRDARLIGFLEGGFELVRHVVGAQLRVLGFGELVAMPGPVELLDIDDLAGRDAQRQHQLLRLAARAGLRRLPLRDVRLAARAVLQGLPPRS